MITKSQHYKDVGRLLKDIERDHGITIIGVLCSSCVGY